LLTMICSPVDFLITYPSNIFSWPPCKLPYTLTFSPIEISSFLLSDNLALTWIEPELSFNVNPLSSTCVIFPSIVLTGGKAKFLIGVVPAHPLTIKTTTANRDRKLVFISISPFSLICLTIELTGFYGAQRSKDPVPGGWGGAGHAMYLIVRD